MLVDCRVSTLAFPCHLTQTMKLNLLPVLACGLLMGLLIGGCSAGDPDLAAAERHAGYGEFDEALAAAQRVIDRDPTNARAFETRARVYGAMAEEIEPGPERVALIEQMMADYDRVRQLEPDNPLLEIALMQAYATEVNVGAQAWDEGRDRPEQFIAAAQAFGSASLIQPDSLVPYYYKGMAYLAAGESELAAPPLRVAVDRGINEPEAYHYLGQIYLAQDRADEAIRVLEAGAERFPDNADIQSDLLNAYARIGDIDRALDAYAQIIADQPDNALLRYNYGSFLLQAGYYEEAVEHLTRATELDPLNAEAWYNLGAAYLNEAIDVHEAMGELDTDTPEWVRRGAERDDLLEQAVPPLEQARAFFDDPQSIRDACTGLFRAYALLHREADAIEAAECAGIDLD